MRWEPCSYGTFCFLLENAWIQVWVFKKTKRQGCTWFCKVCIPTITITHLQHVSGNKLDMSWFGECSGFNRQDTRSSVMHKPQKNTCRVGATALSNYATKIRNNQKLILPRANHRERTKRLWISTMKCTLTTLAFTRQNLNGVFLTAFNVHVDTAA